jgi:hypothetical protein
MFLNLGQTLSLGAPLDVAITVMGGLSTGLSVGIERTAIKEAAALKAT